MPNSCKKWKTLSFGFQISQYENIHNFLIISNHVVYFKFNEKISSPKLCLYINQGLNPTPLRIISSWLFKFQNCILSPPQNRLFTFALNFALYYCFRVTGFLTRFFTKLPGEQFAHNLSWKIAILIMNYAYILKTCIITQPAFTCSKSTTETSYQCARSILS